MKFIVVFDDGKSFCLPMGKDDRCDGAICVAAGTVLLFDTREKARKAIKTSRLFAMLQQSQGVPANEDFLEGYKHVKIRRAGPA